METPVFIAAVGAITAIGEGADACLQSLAAEHSGISALEGLPSQLAGKFPVGEVKAASGTLAAKCGVNPAWPRTALLSAAAVEDCWAPFSARLDSKRIGFFSANTVGGMDKTEGFYPAFLHDRAAGRKDDFRYHECGAVTQLVARHFGFGAYTSTVSTACSSSANSIALAAQMIRAGMIDGAVAGGADALCRFTLNGFNSLGILDPEACRPMDASRHGLNLGEGAGYLLLMNEALLKESGASPLATVSGWGNANDAYHQTASSPDGRGNMLAMKAALAKASLLPGDISYINLHGTGTENNDASEGKAVEQLFGSDVPPASSTKSFTGHTLGAAGGVEAVFSALAIRDGLVYPNLRWSRQMPEVAFAPAVALERRPLKHVLSNSFGFGGACSSLIVSAC